MKVMGISGLPGSGKSLVAEMAAEKGAMIVGMGDIIREKAKQRGESSQTTSIKLREEFGDYVVAELTIEKIKQIFDEGLAKIIIVEGIRSPYEVKLFKENFEDFMILSIFTNPNLRFERLKLRQRADDSTDFKQFQERDQRELDFGIGDVISCSDKMIINESNLDSYTKKIEEFLEEIGL